MFSLVFSPQQFHDIPGDSIVYFHLPGRQEKGVPG
jgi:hypothetical protein